MPFISNNLKAPLVAEQNIISINQHLETSASPMKYIIITISLVQRKNVSYSKLLNVPLEAEHTSKNSQLKTYKNDDINLLFGGNS